MFLKTLKIPYKIKFSVYLIANKKFLVLTTKEQKSIFLLLPKYFVIKKINNFIKIKGKINLENVTFFKRLNFLLNKKSIIIRKQLVLKGLGFKMQKSLDNALELKLGFSHKILLKIPNDLSVNINKNKISIEGFNKNLVGNFIEKIRSLRIPDDYKGKGFWHKNENKILKAIKKS